MLRLCFLSANLVLSLLLIPGFSSAQDSQVSSPKQELQRAREIKLQRLAASWYQQPVELRLKSGSVERGRLLVFEQGGFHLETGSGMKNVPATDVNYVTLKRQPGDLAMTGLTVLGCSGMLAAATSLSSDSNNENVAISALIGGAVGLYFGWKFFYRDVVIRIE